MKPMSTDLLIHYRDGGWLTKALKKTYTFIFIFSNQFTKFLNEIMFYNSFGYKLTESLYDMMPRLIDWLAY